MDVDYEDKFVLKYGALEQDFEELQAETQEVSSQLQKAKEAKLILQAEVRFLRKRVKMLKENASSIDGIREFVSSRGGTIEASQVAAPSWVPAGRGLHEEGLKVASKPLLFQVPTVGAEAAQAFSKNREVVGVLKTSSLKHGANGFPPSKKAGKRKISWQDEFSIKA